MMNVGVDMSYFANDEATAQCVRQYVASRHFKQPYLQFPRGFVQASGCEIDSSRWTARAMPGWNQQWTVDALELTNDAHAHHGDGDECAEWIEHPVLIVQRDTFANFFHDSEDFINAFLAMAVLQWNVADTQIMLTDLYPEGPFW